MLLGGVLDGLSEGVRSRCDRGRILLALDELACATTVEDLREMMLVDVDTIRAALVPDAAPAFFFARFEKAVNGMAEASADGSAAGSSSASEATMPMDVAAPPLPIASPPIASPPSVVTTVKIGAKELVCARMITAAATTTFAALLQLAVADVADVDEKERAQLAALPVKVLLYSSPQHLSSQQAEAQLSEMVAASVSLGGAADAIWRHWRAADV